MRSRRRRLARGRRRQRKCDHPTALISLTGKHPPICETCGAELDIGKKERFILGEDGEAFLVNNEHVLKFEGVQLLSAGYDFGNDPNLIVEEVKLTWAKPEGGDWPD